MFKAVLLTISLLLAGCAGLPDVQQAYYQGAYGEPAASATPDERYAWLVRRFTASGHLDVQPEHLQRAQRVLDKLRVVVAPEYAQTSDWAWKVHVLWHVNRGAGSYGRGRMMITSTLFEELTPTDDQLAWVIGHELAHDLLHLGEMSALFGAPGASTDARFRQMELEADKLGMEIAAKAGYERDAGYWMLWKMRRSVAYDPQNKAYARYPSYDTRMETLKRLH